MLKVSKYGVFSGPYFPVSSPNEGKYEPEKSPYLDTFLSGLILCLNIKLLTIRQLFLKKVNGLGYSKSDF